MEGGALGIPVADYVFRLAEDAEIRIPIRERFEIAHLSEGGSPFHALPDQNDQLMPRHEGRWEEMGRRQTEVSRGTARGYYLWSWENPHPDREIESLEIVPNGPHFIVAGVTLSHLTSIPSSEVESVRRV